MAEINPCFGDHEIMEDLLDSEKAITDLYNAGTSECVSSALRAQMISLLCDSHQMQAEVFDELSRRGWYPTEAAPQEKIKEALDKLQNGNS